MLNEIGSAMKRTLEAVRSGDLSAATRILQGALRADAAGPAPAPGPARADARQAPPPRAGAAFRIRPDAPEAEVAGPAAPVRTLFERLRDNMAAAADCASALAPGSQPEREVEVPKGAGWTAHLYAGAAGSRDYRLFVPSRGARAATGLLLMLHGCKQTPDDFARGTGMLAVAEAQGLILVFPAQPRIANMSGCWNWFDTAHQSAALGEPAILTGIVRQVAAEHGIAADRIFAAGLSAGGAMTAVLADADPELFAAIGVHSGLPAGAAQDVASAFAAMDGRLRQGRAALTAGGPRLIVFHGDADETVAFGNAGRLMGEPAPGSRTEKGVSAGGRRYSRTIVPGARGRPARAESWRIEGAGHAWAGGSAAGSYTDPAGPDASAEMVRFFLGRD